MLPSWRWLEPLALDPMTSSQFLARKLRRWRRRENDEEDDDEARQQPASRLLQKQQAKKEAFQTAAGAGERLAAATPVDLTATEQRSLVVWYTSFP